MYNILRCIFSALGFLGGEKTSLAKRDKIPPPKKPEALKGHLRTVINTWQVARVWAKTF
jgi:hypothetical protein